MTANSTLCKNKLVVLNTEWLLWLLVAEDSGYEKFILVIEASQINCISNLSPNSYFTTDNPQNCCDRPSNSPAFLR